VATAEPSSFLVRHEFLIRRLHSLSGLVPVGAYMVIHLLTNSTVLDSSETFQRLVYQIHGLGSFLPVVEWCFIFLPLLFHAIFGMVIVAGGMPNTSTYRHASNVRYTLQRATGMIAFVFIAWHVFHMHGWFHAQWWLDNVAEPLGGAKFRPFNATSTAAEAIQQSIIIPILYSVGMLSCVFHLANGLWTMGITWGAWTSPAAQRRASAVCCVLGLILAFVGMSSVVGLQNIDVEKAREGENRMYQAKTNSGDAKPDEHKRWHENSDGDSEAGDSAGEHQE